MNIKGIRVYVVVESCWNGSSYTPDKTAVFTKKEDAKKYADWVFKRWGADSDTCIYESNIDDPETLKMIRKEDEK